MFELLFAFLMLPIVGVFMIMTNSLKQIFPNPNYIIEFVVFLLIIKCFSRAL